jgi:hypothetical protein
MTSCNSTKGFSDLFLKITGAAMCAFSVYTIRTKHEYISLITSILYEMSTFVLIGCGGAVILLSLLGIFGTWTGSRKILKVVSEFVKNSNKTETSSHFSFSSSLQF